MTTTINTDVTIEQKAEWVTQCMWNQINDDEWGSSGTPSEWDEDDATRWATAGNTAVLLRRVDIENGSVNAGRVWCEATEGFHYEQDTMDFLHQWFVDNRAAIDRGLASLVPEAQPTAVDPNVSVVLTVGDLVAFEGRLWRVDTNQHGDGSFMAWASDAYGMRENRTLNRADVVRMVPGVSVLRRRENYKSTYTEWCIPGEEYVFNRVYSPQDRAIYIDKDGRPLGFMCQSDFEPVLPVATVGRPWGEGRLLGEKQTVILSDNRLGLLLAEDNRDGVTGHEDEMKVYVREGGRWVDSYRKRDTFMFAVVGDPLLHDDGTTATFVSNHNDPDVNVSLGTGATRRWARQNVHYTGDARTAPAAPKPNPVVVIDGIEYVRKDVVDKDVEVMQSTLHKGSVDNSLCGVYDKVTALSDARTDYLKLGMRYRTYDVEVEQTVTIRRTIRVEQMTDVDSARAHARRVANDYPPRTVESSRRGEANPTIRSYVLTDHSGTATVVG